MKKLILVLLFGIVLNTAYSQTERETTLIFKHKISAKWMQRRFKRVHLTRNIETDCLTYKCEYHIKIKPGDEFLFMPDNKRLVIPCRMQLKLK